MTRRSPPQPSSDLSRRGFLGASLLLGGLSAAAALGLDADERARLARFMARGALGLELSFDRRRARPGYGVTLRATFTQAPPTGGALPTRLPIALLLGDEGEARCAPEAAVAHVALELAWRQRASEVTFTLPTLPVDETARRREAVSLTAALLTPDHARVARWTRRPLDVIVSPPVFGC